MSMTGMDIILHLITDYYNPDGMTAIQIFLMQNESMTGMDSLWISYSRFTAD